MSLHQYPAYKQSGVGWLNQIPAHWEIVPLRFTFQNLDYKRIPLAGQDRADDEKTYPYYGASGIIDYVADYLFDETLILVAEDGANLLSRSSPLAFVASGRYWVNNHAHILKPYGGCLAYWAALLETYDYTPLVTGAAQPKLTADRLGSIRLPQPPPAEQAAIAEFLDRETAKIDALVEEQRRLIELLKEKRQAVISHAVTKGLNPHAPMKPSGIEWLGDVPQHWDEFPLRALFAIKHGYAFDGNEFSDSGKYVLMTPGNFDERGGFRPKVPEKFYASTDVPQEFILENGQLLLAMTEQAPGLLGSALFVPEGAAYLHNQRLGRVHKLRNGKINAHYLFHVFNSNRFRAEVSVSATGAKVRHTSPQKILLVKIFVPPIAEQAHIATFLAEETAKFDLLETESERAIDLLQERRTALISAAVTGKIDVRGLAESEAA